MRLLISLILIVLLSQAKGCDNTEDPCADVVIFTFKSPEGQVVDSYKGQVLSNGVVTNSFYCENDQKFSQPLNGTKCGEDSTVVIVVDIFPRLDMKTIMELNVFSHDEILKYQNTIKIPFNSNDSSSDGVSAKKQCESRYIDITLER
mgnify:CR=1 FL=1